MTTGMMRTGMMMIGTSTATEGIQLVGCATAVTMAALKTFLLTAVERQPARAIVMEKRGNAI